jgi:hypothetical protein
MTSRENVSGSALPGGDLVSAVLNRNVMSLADRGSASALVGQRWADICDEWTADWTSQPVQIPEPGTPASFLVERVVRLDARPEVARLASKQGLQNPDLLFIGRNSSSNIIQAADAKFSVETARVKQVSPGVVVGLLGIAELLGGALDDVPLDAEIVQGVFLCPDYLLTHLMLSRRQGIVRTTVSNRDVLFVPVSAARFLEGLPSARLLPVLQEIDNLPVGAGENLLAGLYYFRIARACVGCWMDARRPLLAMNDQIDLDEGSLLEEIERRARGARSAYELTLDWNMHVDAVRAQRSAVDQVAGLPVSGREIRDLIAAMANGSEEPRPSVNQVRRRLGAWYRAELRSRIGAVAPPVSDLGAVLQRIAAAGTELAADLDRQKVSVVAELIESASEDENDQRGSSRSGKPSSEVPKFL